MTNEQMKALKVGDRLLAWMKVVEIDHEGAYVRARKGNTGYVHADEIHSVEPRPLEVGDRVHGVYEGDVGTIVAIHNESAWVQWASTNCLHGLSSLERAP